MAAIASCQATLTNKIEAVQFDVGLIRQDLDKIRARVSVVEQRVGQAVDTITEQNTSIRTLQSKVRALEYKMDDAENRNRRNNLRIMGLPEGMEGRNPTRFASFYLRHRSPHITSWRGPTGFHPRLGPWVPLLIP